MGTLTSSTEVKEGSFFERDTIIHDRTNNTDNNYDYRMQLAKIRNSIFRNNYLEYFNDNGSGCEYCFLLYDTESSNIESNYFKHHNRDWNTNNYNLQIFYHMDIFQMIVSTL